MRTELDRLLARITREPAYGPSFFRALLHERVFALIPATEVISPEGRVRLIMWTGQDGSRIIPFFSNEEVLGRALAINLETQAIRLRGRVFLEASRGATVVLNPNEPLYCRLTPGEVALLLDTGSPNAPEPYQSPEGTHVGFTVPVEAHDLLNSLVLLLCQFPEVDRAYLRLGR
jgi:hypothetical protein